MTNLNINSMLSKLKWASNHFLIAPDGHPNAANFPSLFSYLQATGGVLPTSGSADKTTDTGEDPASNLQLEAFYG